MTDQQRQECLQEMFDAGYSETQAYAMLEDYEQDAWLDEQEHLEYLSQFADCER